MDSFFSGKIKAVDLSCEIYHHMEVYPGDPPVEISQVHRLEKEGWELRKLHLGTHTGTHVDAFSHMDPKGESLSQMGLHHFFGWAVKVDPREEFPKGLGLFFQGEVEDALGTRILRAEAPFVGGAFSPELERFLLTNGVVTYTDLCAVEKLPFRRKFLFFGLPLRIREGDGSPVRAVALFKEEEEW